MNLKKTIAFWERVMTSITFAEANEPETALRVLEKKELGTSPGKDGTPPEGETGHQAGK